MKYAPLTPDERERLKDDFSAPAVERYAAFLLSKWPQADAVTAAEKHRDACPSANDPRRDFWSRVIVQILAAKKENEQGRGVATESAGSTGNAHVGGTPARTAGPYTEGPPRRDEASPALSTNEQQDVRIALSHGREAGKGPLSHTEARPYPEPLPAPRWRDESDNRKSNDDPKQGSLF